MKKQSSLNLEEITGIDWIMRWAGSYTFISASYWARQYQEALERELGIGFDHSLFIHREGTVSFFLPRTELNKFGKELASQAEKDIAVAERWCRELKRNTDVINGVMDELGNTIPAYSKYKEFLTVFERHLPFHNAIKKPVDYFPEKTLKKLMPIFKDARLYSENVYSDTEKFFRSITKVIGEKEDYNSHYLTCLTQEEFEKYLKNGSLPKESVLKPRYQLSVLYFNDGILKVESLPASVNIEKMVFEKALKNRESVAGIVAYKGKVSGKIRVVSNPHEVGIFNEGDILVTGMTRPEFLPVMQKAGAIITDAGGILCHAAISAREMKKPCIVGTQIATSFFHSGDLVEVDADAGVISVLN